MGRIKNAMLKRLDSAARRDSLADLQAKGLNVRAWCQRCSHHQTLELDMLIKRFGPHMPVPEIGAQIQCPHCASKAVATAADWKNPRKVITRHAV